MLEIVEREAFKLSGCLVFGEIFQAAMFGRYFFKDGGLALVESRPPEGLKQLNCLDEFLSLVGAAMSGVTRLFSV